MVSCVKFYFVLGEGSRVNGLQASQGVGVLMWSDVADGARLGELKLDTRYGFFFPLGLCGIRQEILLPVHSDLLP